MLLVLFQADSEDSDQHGPVPRMIRVNHWLSLLVVS